jgi:hypothetical protein
MALVDPQILDPEDLVGLSAVRPWNLSSGIAAAQVRAMLQAGLRPMMVLGSGGADE